MSLGRLGGMYALLEAGSKVGDMWVQTDRQACTKGTPGWEGRKACATHVATLTATQGVFLAVGVLATGERLNPRRVALGLAVNAASHYWADRRTPFRKLAELSWVGKDEFYDLGQPPLATGAHALDQSWHIGWCAIAATIIAGRTDR